MAASNSDGTSTGVAPSGKGLLWPRRIAPGCFRFTQVICRGYEDFLAKMRAEGYEIKEGKELSFRAPGQARFTRSNRLGSDYTKEALRERCTTRRGRSVEVKKAVPHTGRKVNMLIIENGLTDYDELAARAAQAGDRFDDVSRHIKQLEARMAEVAQLKKHIINYSKTREVYATQERQRESKQMER